MKITVEAEVPAPLAMVWDAWVTPEDTGAVRARELPSFRRQHVAIGRGDKGG